MQWSLVCWFNQELDEQLPTTYGLVSIYLQETFEAINTLMQLLFLFKIRSKQGINRF